MAKISKQRQQDFNACYVTRNHWWKPTTVDDDNPDYYVQHMVCMRCDGHRRWRINKRTGDPMGNSYTMQEGYYHTYDEDENPQQVRKELRLHEVEHLLTSQQRSLRRVK